MSCGSHLADLLRLHLRLVLAIIRALDFLDHLVDSLGLLRPFALAHLELLLEQLIIGLPVATTHAVPQRGKLTVVVVEVQVVHGMASGAVDNGRVVRVLSVVDEHGPNVDKDEEGDVCELLEREKEGKDVVWQPLRVAVHGVEGM